MAYIKLQNGNYIACNVCEVTAFPKANMIDGDETSAFAMTKKVFSQIAFEFHKMSAPNRTAAEFLWVAQAVENQTFRSMVRLFIVLRSIGSSAAQSEKELAAVQSNMIHALNRAKFDTCAVDINDSAFTSLVKQVDCSADFAVVKTEKIIGNAMSQSLYYTWDILNTDSEDTMAGFISAISQNRNCAVSLQIIPTNLSEAEQTVLNNLSTLYQQAVSTGDTHAATAARSNQYVLDRRQQPLFYYNVNVFGQRDACKMITTKLVSLMQSGSEKNADCNLIALDMSREHIGIAKQFFAYPWMINKALIMKYRNPEVQQYQLAQIIGKMPYLMSCEELNVFFRFPLYDASIPALKQKRGGGDAELFSEEIVGEDTIKVGELMAGDSSRVQLGVPLDSWTQHALIVGMPGTGKTTFAVNILTQFYKKGIPFLAIEPTKAEYRAMIDAVDDLQIFTPGNNAVSPFIINPFLPPRGITVEQYIPSLLNAFKAAFSMDGPLEMLFQKAVNACYIEYGWKRSSKQGDEGTQPFGMFEYVQCFKRVMKTMNYKGDVQSNIETAGLLRLMNLIEQNSDIYDTVNTVPIEDMLSKPTVLELNAIDNEEQKALIMALVLSSICVYTKNIQKSAGHLKNVILIDEAHVLLDAGGDRENQGQSKAIAVNTIQRMIAEIRAYGTGIIIADQKPSAVTESIVSNTNVKITFRITSSRDRTLIAESTDMSEANAEELSRLGIGQAYVYFDRLNSPQPVQTKDTRKEDGIRLGVPDKEIAARSSYWKDKRQRLIPFRECACSKVCQTCSFAVRNDAEYFASKLLNNSLPKISDKKKLMAYACHIPDALKNQQIKYSVQAFEQLCSCTVIKYCRKAKLSLPYPVTNRDISSVMAAINHTNKENSHGGTV